MDYSTVRPFIKWAGGKSQLLNEIRTKYPSKIEKYCEPFLGGGAVLFDVLANFQPTEVIVNDINKELVNTYKQVQKNCEEVIRFLSGLQDKYLTYSAGDRKSFYLSKREYFNSLKTNSSEKGNLEKAVLFIFLNKTCFNGLYRVNSKGLFNVPMGAYRQPLICDKKNLELCSALLNKVVITCSDYSITSDFIDSKTFVYIDPPYRPLSATASFTAYSEFVFADQEQIKLGNFVDSITKKGAKAVVSNSDPKNINKDDNFFDDLYKEYKINRIEAKRMINSKASNRGSINELLICNF